MCTKHRGRGRLYSVPGVAEVGDDGEHGSGTDFDEDSLRDMFSPENLGTVAIVTFLRLVDSTSDDIAFLAASTLMDIAEA
jgi:hypothetical protein